MLVAVLDGWLLEVVVGAVPVDFLSVLVLIVLFGSVLVELKLVCGWCLWGRIVVVFEGRPGSGGFGFGLGLDLGGCLCLGIELELGFVLLKVLLTSFWVVLMVLGLGLIEKFAKDCSMFLRLGRAVEGSFSRSKDLALSWSWVMLMSASTARLLSRGSGRGWRSRMDLPLDRWTDS